ncbi:hypothetical protein FSP39_010518 [Pinctada imbricata]|uniref:WAP domain-containing protein n=1 Tax=Pinctada imbricata TaxID=66713 RepID=A0AA89BUE8_PINIB|nr:hypothetical protein FSP39_010518 [Pinctada imbricata]
MRRSTCSYPPCKKFPVCVQDESTTSRPNPINPETHPGVCILPTIPGPCMEQCQTDGDCRGHEKCCYNGCGKTCSAAGTVQVTKPGSCPRRLSSESLCGMDCMSDNDCPGVEKCCVTACGSTCSRPCYYWLWTLPNRATGTRSAVLVAVPPVPSFVTPREGGDTVTLCSIWKDAIYESMIQYISH